MYDLRQLGPKLALAVRALPATGFAEAPVAEAPKWPHTHDAASWSREFARFASFRYGLPLPRYTIAFEPMDGHAGRVIDAGHECQIIIDSRYVTDIEILGHVIAHEVAHLVLNRVGLRAGDEWDNELLTDTLAVLAGFGPLMLAGKQRSRSNATLSTRSTTTTRIGYLAESDIAWLMAVRSRLGSDAPWPRRSINRRRHQSTTCPVCQTKLRLPDVVATIDIRCPSCTVRQRLCLRGGSLIAVALQELSRRVRSVAAI
jgi:hypothetical protein